MLILNFIPILENKAVFNQFIVFKKPISSYYDEASFLGDGSFMTVYELPQSYDFKNNTNLLKSNLLSPRELFNKDQKWQQVGWSNTPVKAKDFKYIAFATYDVLNSREEIKLAKILKTATVLLEREHNIYSFLKQEHDVEGHREKLISNIILIIFDLKGSRLYLIEHHT